MNERHRQWETLYQNREFGTCRCDLTSPETSLGLIAALHLPKEAAILDVGGGESHLTAFLLKEGFSQLSVLDISPTALEKSQKRMGVNAVKVTWIASDVTRFETEKSYDLWHDRAAFHFLKDPKDIAAYVATAGKRVRAGGHDGIGTLSPHGPTRCSGIHIHKYRLNIMDT